MHIHTLPFLPSLHLGWSSHLQFQACFLIPPLRDLDPDLCCSLSITFPMLLDPSCQFFVSSSFFHFSFLKTHTHTHTHTHTKPSTDTSLHAAAAKLLQSCPTLCDSIDGSPPRFPVPGILQARTLEWVAISFSNA